jgi:nucleoid-associated protein YgaU
MKTKRNRRALLSGKTEGVGQSWASRLGFVAAISSIVVGIVISESMRRTGSSIGARVAGLLRTRRARLGLASGLTLMISALAMSVVLVASPASAQSGCGTYTVQRGDTLSAIALRCYGDASRWSDIYALNRNVIGANPNLIFPGQVLTISAAQPGQSPGGAITVPSTYVVQPGDSLSSIALRAYGVADWGTIYNANRAVIGPNPSLIFPGQRLAIPTGGQTGRGIPANYIVQPGDNLSVIAFRIYGDANRWSDIYAANRAIIGSNPSLIFSGTQLSIP